MMQPLPWSYRLRDAESGVEVPTETANLVEACGIANRWQIGVERGELASTMWVDTLIIDPDGVIEKRHTTAIDPKPPKCVEGSKHDWQSPFELVGGVEVNPGVWSSGGGVIIHEACIKCGALKATNTWAQRPDNGQCGLTSVSYEASYYDLSELEGGAA
ncbi:MAG: hypothetical protein QM756_24085 [Polyangiaceae bacterium]